MAPRVFGLPHWMYATSFPEISPGWGLGLGHGRKMKSSLLEVLDFSIFEHFRWR